MSKRIPAATYRLQFNRDFTFAQAGEILDYLKELGITDCYASPIFRAGPESTHGYDICCFAEVSPALGGGDAFRKFSAAARERGLGVLLDMVPNHMGSAPANAWWADVLKHGRNSPYADFFDIDWDPPTPGLRGKVLLPVLEDHYWKVLESGKLRVAQDRTEFAIAYHDRFFPIAPESKASLKPLHQLLQKQHYRLAHWRLGRHEINYRRFFDITELVSLRMERPEVFAATHKLLFEFIAAGLVTGLRIDHPDGLWDPQHYFERLQQHGPIYVVAEKILSGDEPLPDDWPVEGTTGYDFLNRLNGIYVNQANELEMTRTYQEFTGCKDGFETVVYASKKRVLELSFQSEINSLAHRLKSMPPGRDFPVSELRASLMEVAANFPVYRTYATETRAPDLSMVRGEGDAVELIRHALGSDRQFVMKFQQLTGPVMAKGVEDTAFYIYNRLLSLNEVGGNPGAFGVSVEALHKYNLEKLRRWPHSLLATATHDTKRGEDLRARLNVLSEMPHEWAAGLNRWRQINGPAPDANAEYLMYQTLVGAWDASPDFCERICAFMIKAMREAKARTSWTDPDAAYENAMLEFVKRVLTSQEWLADFQQFQSRVAFFGKYNSLSQVLLKMTCPGVPDFYQGTELWDFNLVDPDNRRPVDYRVRRESLRRVMDERDSKLHVIWRTLQFRNQHPELFREGDYVPIRANTEHVCAFVRTWKDQKAVVVAPRLLYGLCEGRAVAPIGEIWGDAALNIPAEPMQNIFTSAPVRGNRLTEILKSFPIAVLARSSSFLACSPSCV